MQDKAERVYLAHRAKKEAKENRNARLRKLRAAKSGRVV